MSDTEADCCIWHSANPPRPKIAALRQVEVWTFPEHHGRWAINTTMGHDLVVPVREVHITWLDVSGSERKKWALERIVVLVPSPWGGGADSQIECTMSPAPQHPTQNPPLWVRETVKLRLAELNGTKP